MEARIVIINGSGGSGKSTFVKLCQEILEDNISWENNWEILELSTVDWVKAVAQFAGWDGKKDEKDRRFLYQLKMALEEWDNSPNQKVFDQINSVINNEMLNKKNWLFFVNIREPKCIENFIKQNEIATGLPCSTMLVKNANVAPIISNPADGEVHYYHYDTIISNSSDLENLKKWAHDYLKHVQKIISYILHHFVVFATDFISKFGYTKAMLKK